jgi:hypothetical protein
MSASSHSYMGMQQKLFTAASASVQACTGAEIQQQSTEMHWFDVCASMHRHQTGQHAAPAAVNAREHSQAARHDL